MNAFNAMLSWVSGAPGWVEIMVIVLVIMLLFGAKRLPELSRSIGRSISEFKKGRQEGILTEGDDDKEPDETPKKEEA